MYQNKRGTAHPMNWIAGIFARVFEPAAQPVPVSARGAQDVALAGLQRRSRAARMVH